MKLKTKIVYSFDIETSAMDGFDFIVDHTKYPKKKAKIIEVANKKKQIKQDASTRLF